MAGADIITVEANGDDGVMKDRHALRNGIEPPLDTVNNWVLKTVRNGSKNIYFITRKLNTGDTEDNIIVNGTNNMIFAYGPTSTIKYHTSARRSPFSMTIDVYTGVISTGEGILTIDNSNINRHGIMMYVAWGWLSIAMIITGRYSKYFIFWRIYLHGFIGLSILTITSVAIYSVNKK